MCSIKNCNLNEFKNGKCILHCEKSGKFEDIKNFNICFEKLFKSNNEINDIHFPKEYDFNKSFYDKNGFKFINCHFYSQLNLNGHEYINCHFHKYVNLSRNKSSTIILCKFKECTFASIVKINYIFAENLFDNCNFEKKYLYLNNINLNNINYLFNDSKIEKFHFYNCRFSFKINLREINHIKKLVFRKCKFEDRFSIQHSEIKGALRLRDSKFLSEKESNSKVKIQFSEISKGDFHNTKFQDLADFYQTKFKKVNFKRTDFEKIVVFSETEFYCDVDFKYTKFLGKSIFRDTVITGTLNLRNSIFDDDANFLDITSKKREKEKKTNEFIGETFDIKVKNRETARIIKNFFDNQNNTIEANKFYALEMKEREKELEIDRKNGKNFFNWIVFKIHGISSNHSQNWTLALFWIFIVGFFSAFVDFIIKNDNSIVDIVKSILMVITVFGIDKICKLTDKLQQYVYYLISTFLIYIFITEDYLLKMFVKTMNVTSFFKTDVDINIFQFGFKIILAYLIYQLIISIRQNTRRK